MIGVDVHNLTHHFSRFSFVASIELQKSTNQSTLLLSLCAINRVQSIFCRVYFRTFRFRRKRKKLFKFVFPNGGDGVRLPFVLVDGQQRERGEDEIVLFSSVGHIVCDR
jgi:hypothetical protein